MLESLLAESAGQKSGMGSSSGVKKREKEEGAAIKQFFDPTALRSPLSRHVVALGGGDCHSLSLPHSSDLALMEGQKVEVIRL